MEKMVNMFATLVSTEYEMVSLEKVMEIIRSDQLRDVTLMYRSLKQQLNDAEAKADEQLAEDIKTQMVKTKKKCPAIICQAIMDGGRDATAIRAYTGMFMVDFDHVPKEQMAMTKALIEADRHTLITYTSISGEGLRVIACVEGEVDYENYLDAWKTVNDYYAKLTGLIYDKQCLNNTRLCGLAYDPKATYKPAAKPLKIKSYKGKNKTKQGKRTGRPPKAKNVAKRVMEMVEQDGANNVVGSRNDYISRCIYLMNRYGVTLDDCTEWAKDEFADYDKTHPKQIAQMVASVYGKHNDEHGTLQMGGKPTRKASVKEVEDFVKEKYNLRRNMLSYNLEYERKGDDGGGRTRVVDDHFVNSLWREMQNSDINADMQTINAILGSDFVEDYHPFIEWIRQLPRWDGTTDYIGQFFSMVHFVDVSPDDFHYFTRCWFLAMVASLLDEKVVNHQILTFIGAQGTYKSSFMQHILPPLLRSYYAAKTNSFQLDKDDYLMLAENIIVSLEEIDSMSSKELNQLKAFTTMPQVKERPPYGRHKVLMPRVASLTATGNNLTYLTDVTGNRRWLSFHVKNIDNPWTASIPYEGMYAQALALIKSGERYWLNDTDIQRLNEMNSNFQAPDPATEMIVTYFFKPRSEAETKYLTASKIAARFAPYLKISPTKIGMALGQLGYEQVRNHAGRFWKIAYREGSEIDSRLPGEEADEMPF